MLTHENFLANSENGIRCHHLDRAEGPVDVDPDRRPALSRHRLQHAS